MSDGGVKSPGGYLRGLIEKAQVGDILPPQRNAASVGSRHSLRSAPRSSERTKPALCIKRTKRGIKMTPLLVVDRPIFTNGRNQFTAFNCLRHSGRYADTGRYRSAACRRYFVVGRNFFTTQSDRWVRCRRMFLECSRHFSRKPAAGTVPCRADCDFPRRSFIRSSPDA